LNSADSTQPLLAVAGLIRCNDEVLLIEQKAPVQAKPTWSLPGGRLEPGELLLSGLTREIHEETGLTVIRPGELLYFVQLVGTDHAEAAWVFEIPEWSGEILPDDPDELILNCEFVAIPEAIDRLSTLPWDHMREPITSYLCGESGPGSVWCYREDDSGMHNLIDYLPGMSPGQPSPRMTGPFDTSS
jgi:ADP-ribose pyrophosphatase YjhB (NUDIX family)